MGMTKKRKVFIIFREVGGCVPGGRPSRRLTVLRSSGETCAGGNGEAGGLRHPMGAPRLYEKNLPESPEAAS